MTAESWSAGPIPARTVDAVTASLGDVVQRTITAVRSENPVYDNVLGGPEGIGITLGIEQAIKSFLEAVRRGERPPEEAGEIWRRLGEAEFQAGRGLDTLRAGFRTGTRAVWRSAATIASEAGVESEQVIALAEAIFVYTDELAADVVEGYMRAQTDEAGERERRRRRLASLLLDGEHHDQEAIERAAQLARWAVPRELAALAFPGEVPPGITSRLGGDALAGADSAGGWLLLPDPDGPGHRKWLARGLGGATAALGPTVAPREARRSLRWARQAIALIERRALAAESPTRASDHLGTLILMQDPELAAELATSRLAPLDAVPPGDRDRLLETLRAWLAHQRHTPRIAEQLHVHPQTVRYRLATLRELFGETIDTPEGRFELELALRAREAVGR
jgi:hypothetical protein